MFRIKNRAEASRAKVASLQDLFHLWWQTRFLSIYAFISSPTNLTLTGSPAECEWHRSGPRGPFWIESENPPRNSAVCIATSLKSACLSEHTTMRLPHPSSSKLDSQVNGVWTQVFRACSERPGLFQAIHWTAELHRGSVPRREQLFGRCNHFECHIYAIKFQ